MAILLSVLVATASVVALTAAFTDVWAGAVWFALAPIFYLVTAARTNREACGYAALFAWGWTFSSLWFLAKTTTGGAMAAGAYTGLWYFLALLVVRRLARHGVCSAVFGTAAVWCLVEIGRSRIPVFGFPWLLLGHATAGMDYLRQPADLLGVYGLSFLVAAVNGVLAFVAGPLLVFRWSAPPGSPTARRMALIAVLALLLAALFYGRWRVHTLEPQLTDTGPRIVVIQGCEYRKLDRSDEEKWAQLNSHLQLHVQAAKLKPRPDLICWAETMVPGVYNVEPYAERFRQVVREQGIPAFCGADWIHPDDLQKPPIEQRWLNSAFLLDGKAETVGQYAKRRLVPFGEYVPFKALLPWMQRIGSVTRDAYAPGKEPSPIVPFENVNWAMNICIEDCHPDLARASVWDGAEGFLNVTNDGWFAGTHEPATHLRGAIFRCIETRRPMLRATNSGQTALIDPLGRALVRPAPDQGGLGVFEVRRLPDPPMPLVLYLGEGWAAVLFLMAALAAWILDQRLPLLLKKKEVVH